MTFTLEEAKSLVEGTYYAEEEDEAQAPSAAFGATPVYGDQNVNNLVMAGAIQSFNQAALMLS